MVEGQRHDRDSKIVHVDFGTGEKSEKPSALRTPILAESKRAKLLGLVHTGFEIPLNFLIPKPGEGYRGWLASLFLDGHMSRKIGR
jgi:hypothetical protein